MPIPTDSTAPVPISTTDPAVSAGETSIVRFSKRVRDWITGLSPAGATVYDTGWTPVTVVAGVTVVSPVEVRRVGRVIYWRGEVSAAWTTANTPVVAAGGVPAWARPQFTYRDTGASLGSSGAVAAVGTVGTDGGVPVRALTATTGAVYLKNLSGYLAG